MNNLYINCNCSCSMCVYYTVDGSCSVMRGHIEYLGIKVIFGILISEALHDTLQISSHIAR